MRQIEAEVLNALRPFPHSRLVTALGSTNQTPTLVTPATGEKIRVFNIITSQDSGASLTSFNYRENLLTRFSHVFAGGSPGTQQAVFRRPWVLTVNEPLVVQIFALTNYRYSVWYDTVKDPA